MLIVKEKIGEQDLNTFSNPFVKTPVLKSILSLKSFGLKYQQMKA